MARIGVIADSHRNLTNVRDAISSMENVDLIIHLGDCASDAEYISKIIDKPVLAVKGNNDFACDLPKEIVHTIGGKRLLLTHGDNYGVKYSLLRLSLRASELNVDAALFGHTHMSHVGYDGGVLLINPGSLQYNRLLTKPSFCIIDVSSGNIVPTIHVLSN